MYSGNRLICTYILRPLRCFHTPVHMMLMDCSFQLLIMMAFSDVAVAIEKICSLLNVWHDLSEFAWLVCTLTGMLRLYDFVIIVCMVGSANVLHKVWQ